LKHEKLQLHEQHFIMSICMWIEIGKFTKLYINSSDINQNLTI
jgi:hypothetical protein